MKIFVTGATGIIGELLVENLRGAGHVVLALSRSQHPSTSDDNLQWVQGDCTQRGDWQTHLAGVDAVVHLAGESVFNRRWSKAQKQIIYDSRIESSKRIVEAIEAASSKPDVLISASGDMYYGARGEEELDESSTPGEGFMAELSRDWEAACAKANDLGVRTVYLRLGAVLSPRGGALPGMVNQAKFFLGGSIGPPESWTPWIHEDDVVGLVTHALNTDIHGPVNAVAPGLVRMSDFAGAVASTLGRPCWFNVPRWFLRLAVGEFGNYIGLGLKIIPRAAIDSGYVFKYPSIDAAIRACLGG